MPRSVSTVIVAGLTAITIGALSGCAPEPAEPSPSPSRPSTASPTAVPSVPASPAPTATEGPDDPGTPIGASCLDLTSLDDMYQFDPNFGLNDDYSPPAGTLGAVAVANAGIACGWVQQTSGEVIEIAAAEPSEAAIERLRTDAGADDGARVFSTDGSRGVVQAFVGPYWIVATSSYFGTADDAAPLVDAALAALD